MTGPSKRVPLARQGGARSRVRKSLLGLCAGLGLLQLFADVPLQAATGGPDAFGYEWRDTADGALYAWKEINTTAVDLALGDDNLSAPQNLGFSFRYYGVDYT